MLASSPLSSSTFARSGYGLSMHPPAPSPRQAATATQKTTTKNVSNHDMPTFHTGPSPRSEIVNYQNASTQYSPVAESELKTPSQGIANPENTLKRETAPEASILSTSSGSSTHQAAKGCDPIIYTSHQQSPTSRRRQFRETVEADSASPSALSYPPKRTKPSKTSAKVLPVSYEFCDVEDMVALIADMISELIETNDNLPLRDVVLTRFHSRTPPGISVMDYLQRLAKHATLSPPLLLSMVYYIDRLCSLYPAFSITSLTVHRFLITAATVAAKGLSDSFWNNSTYARVGGIKLAELGLLELEFLYRLDWRIVPNPEVLVDYYRGLIARTEDYTLEVDVSASDAEQEVMKQDQNAADGEIGNISSHAGTDSQWEEWMKDVADNTGDLKQPETVP